MKILIILFLISTNIFANSKKLESFFKEQTTIKDPFSLRDPFQAPKLSTKKQQERKQRMKGVWDFEQKLTEDVKLEEIKITGVLIGANRRAIMRIGNFKKPFTFKEGDKLGPNGPEIRAILPGGIILVEQINNIYGEPEYIETVIPISK